MADVVRLPGLLEQIRLVAGLRWRILRNGLRNKNRVWDLAGVMLSSILGIVLVSGLSFAIFFGTSFFLRSHQPERITLLFWGIFVWWQILPIFVAGFSPRFSFHSLLRFPWKLSTFYVIGISYGLADSAAIASLIWLFVMMAATAVTEISLLPAMIFACALFVAVNVALERWVGSWVEKLLSKRRSRELFLVLFVLGMTCVQFIGPAMEKYQRSAKKGDSEEKVALIVKYARPLPASLAGRIVTGAAERDFSSMAIGAAGLAGYALLFGALLFFRYRAQYFGEELSETVAPSRLNAKRPPHEQRTQVSESSPGTSLLPPTVSAVLMKETRYLLRNGFTALLLLSPPILLLFFTMQFGGAHPSSGKNPVSATYFFPGMMAYLTLVLMAPSFNSFAFEGRGMQTYFMVPVKFGDILIGKNLMTVAIMIFETGLSVVLVRWRVGLPPMPIFFATISALIFAVMGQLTIANWSSLMFPRKMDFGKMQGNRQSGMAVLITFGAQIVFSGTCSLVFVAGRFSGNDWLAAELFLFLAAAALAGYWSSLEPLTRLAEKKKESLLEILTK
ncbi:MAG: hypothetical protein JSS69_17435 [Acidobacteria bacterium]|nr:hypothetical protein [Acidobacteriota bacterium]MBS1867700.1 hypothetical protein [Acidobacteriota bacterium]